MIPTLFAAIPLTLVAAQTAPPAPPKAPIGVQAGAWDPAKRIAAQREAMAALSFLDGQWRGPGTAYGQVFTQTERVGTLLDGTIRLVEGRAYDASGGTVFNAFAVISYDPVKRAYAMRSHAGGFAGDAPLEVRKDGFRWHQPMGPGATLRYTATLSGGRWHEIGERIAGDAPPVKMFEMTLTRLGPSRWPAGDATAPR